MPLDLNEGFPRVIENALSEEFRQKGEVGELKGISKVSSLARLPFGKETAGEVPSSPFRSWLFRPEFGHASLVKVLLVPRASDGPYREWLAILIREKKAFEIVRNTLDKPPTINEGEPGFQRGVVSLITAGQAYLGAVSLGKDSDFLRGEQREVTLTFLRRPCLPWASLASFSPSFDTYCGVYEAILDRVERVYGIVGEKMRKRNRLALRPFLEKSVLITPPPWARNLLGGPEDVVFQDWNECLPTLPFKQEHAFPLLFLLADNAMVEGGRVPGPLSNVRDASARPLIGKAYAELNAQISEAPAAGFGDEGAENGSRVEDGEEGAADPPSSALDGMRYPYLIGWLPSTWRFEWRELWE